MESASSVLPLIPGMILTTDQPFELGFKNGSLCLVSFAIPNHGKDYPTMNTSDVKIKIRTSHYAYMPVLILRP